MTKDRIGWYTQCFLFWLHPLLPSLSPLLVMDTKAVFAALYSVCEENATFFSGGAKGPQGDAARRLVDVMKLIREHARSLEPVISGFASVYHHFDFDPHIPANGYRSLVKVNSDSDFEKNTPPTPTPIYIASTL